MIDYNRKTFTLLRIEFEGDIIDEVSYASYIEKIRKTIPTIINALKEGNNVICNNYVYKAIVCAMANEVSKDTCDKYLKDISKSDDVMHIVINPNEMLS